MISATTTPGRFSKSCLSVQLVEEEEKEKDTEKISKIRRSTVSAVNITIWFVTEEIFF